MKSFWTIISIIVVIAGMAIGFITFGCQDDWCYIFPWQKPGQTQVPPYENFTPYEATLDGEYTCLPHRNTSGPQTLECALGLKSNNVFYSLDMSALPGFSPSFNTATGTKVRVTGTVVPIDAISSDQWQKYDIKGIMKVKIFTIL